MVIRRDWLRIDLIKIQKPNSPPEFLHPNPYPEAVWVHLPYDLEAKKFRQSPKIIRQFSEYLIDSIIRHSYRGIPIFPDT